MSGEERGTPGIIDWAELTGQSWFTVDLISIPIFSAFAGVITNWTGVIMLFSPVRFTGFYVPGLKTLFPFLPRKLQILPTFAPGGILGFQGFIPARAEKMASFMVDKSIAKIGSIRDFLREMEPEAIAAHVAEAMRPQLRQLVTEVMEREHPELWRDMPAGMKEMVYQRAEEELSGIAQRAFVELDENVEHLVDAKLLIVGYLRRHPEMLKDIIYSMGAPELRFMTKSGLLGAPMGLLLVLYLQVHDGFFLLSWMPHWLVVVVGAYLIGIIVNIIAVRVVFTPGEPQPRYKYLWKQALFAKRQDHAAADLGHAIGYKILTMPNIAHELLHGPRGDRTMRMLEKLFSAEIKNILGPAASAVRVAVGTKEFDAIQAGAGSTAAVAVAPALTEDEEFTKVQAGKIDMFATKKLRELSPGEFMDMLYSAVEQDAWLLYAHGGALGVLVGAGHVLLFGA